MIFSDYKVSTFLNGLIRAFPPVKELFPVCDLNIALASFLNPCHHVRDTTFLLTIFLIAITLAHTVSEIQAVMADPPYAVFHKNRVTFKRDQKFLSKVVL